MSDNESIEKIKHAKMRISQELRGKIIGQEKVIEQIIISILCKGHCLLTGVPGLGKTLLVKSIAEIFDLSFKRIQFTPDLMPADIFGTDVIEEDTATGKHSFKFMKGPIFANMVLADEINRTPPKTQAALLEAMEEKHVTAGGKTYSLDQPFFVLATQNPIELEGTYPLPEAQLDRFLFNIKIDYLTTEEEIQMVSETTGKNKEPLKTVFTAAEILELQNIIREVPVSENVLRYAVNISTATRPESEKAAQISKEKVRWGAGSRASQAMILAAKAKALLEGRFNASCQDVKDVALPVLRHRLIPNFHADAEGIDSDHIILEILKTVTE